MRVVVTGATGNVGTRLIDRMVDDEGVTSVVGIARRAPEWTAPKVSWVEADVATDDLRPTLSGADVLVHLAWLFQPTHRPLVTWGANALGSARVFKAAGQAEIGAVVYASSVGAYSPAPGRTVTESWPTHGLPTVAYGREKAYNERLLDSFQACHPGVRVVRMRPGFIFQKAAATEQRRLFAGPFVPRRLVEPGRLPFLILPRGLRFPAVHADDVADAFHQAVIRDVEGAFNLAAEPPIDDVILAKLLETRAVTVPKTLLRPLVNLAWRARAVPTDPALLDLLMGLPLLNTVRAGELLDWTPRHSAVDAMSDMFEGMATGYGFPTPPLAPDSAEQRVREVVSGPGERG